LGALYFFLDFFFAGVLAAGLVTGLIWAIVITRHPFLLIEQEVLVVLAVSLLEAIAALTDAIVFASFGIVIDMADLVAWLFQVLPMDMATGLAMLIFIAWPLEAVGLGAIALVTHTPLISD